MEHAANNPRASYYAGIVLEYFMHEISDAQKLYKQAIRLYEEQNNTTDIVLPLHNIGMLLIEQNKTKKCFFINSICLFHLIHKCTFPHCRVKHMHKRRRHGAVGELPATQDRKCPADNRHYNSSSHKTTKTTRCHIKQPRNTAHKPTDELPAAQLGDDTSREAVVYRSVNDRSSVTPLCYNTANLFQGKTIEYPPKTP